MNKGPLCAFWQLGMALANQPLLVNLLYKRLRGIMRLLKMLCQAVLLTPLAGYTQGEMYRWIPYHLMTSTATPSLKSALPTGEKFDLSMKLGLVCACWLLDIIWVSLP